MAVIFLFRVSIFALLTLLSFVVLGVCAHIQYLAAARTNVYLSLAPFGLGVACLTIICLPLFLAVEKLCRPVFTSTILFEVIWFFVLWILWAGVAGGASFGKAYHFPAGCIYGNYPAANQICHEITTVEAFAFLNFLCASTYHVIILLYAIISSIHGRRIWNISVKESTAGAPRAINNLLPMAEPRSNAVYTVQHRTYAMHTITGASHIQPHNASLQDVTPVLGYPQRATRSPYIPPAQNQPYDYAEVLGTRQQQVSNTSYSSSPTIDYVTHPPQPNSRSYSAEGSHAPLQ